ncbi:PRC-barrel domain containing protein (plasmid) [Halorientalis pallida]|uniref:PRC-barrel domain containing protein n=1 Tax=Halorientalis pallida TaxID=2479928 RepID=UPI003C6FE494
MTGERATLSESDEGKTVVDADGTEIGMVTAVSGDSFEVQPDPSLVDRVKATLDWGEQSEDVYRIDANRIDRITGTEIELRPAAESDAPSE